MSVRKRTVELSTCFQETGINWDELVIDTFNKTQVSSKLGINSRQFLAYAHEDLGQEGDRHYANALANAKRALDCQVERIVRSFGLGKSSDSFPAKLDIAQQLNVVTPGILRRVNKKRNVLEHEFRLPARGEAEDAVDIAALFIEATDHLLEHFPHEISLGNVDLTDKNWQYESMEPAVTLRFDARKSHFTLRRGHFSHSRARAALTIPASEPSYRHLVAFAVGLRRGYGYSEPLQQLLTRNVKVAEAAVW